jgi:sodium transport system ATP-binding protein
MLRLEAGGKLKSQLLRVEGLTKEFNGLRAVDGISFDAAPGEVFGLLGPNGAGKTTAIRLIATILTPTRGTARVCGYDIHDHPEAVRQHIGILTTEMGVYDRLTGREHLRYFGTLYSIPSAKLEHRIGELTRLLEMEDFVDRRAGTYSTGMKQKLSIARSVLHDPPVLILDEPTSGLDVLASQTVLNFMRQAQAQGKLVILSTHRMPDAERLCDRVAIMHMGRLLTIQSVAGLKGETDTHSLEDAFLVLVGSQEEARAPAPAPKSPGVARRRLVRLGIAAAVVVGWLLWRLLRR